MDLAAFKAAMIPTIAEMAGRVVTESRVDGLAVRWDPSGVSIVGPHEAAVAQYGDGVRPPESWVERSVLSVGGSL